MTTAQRLAACKAYAIKDRDLTTKIMAQEPDLILASIDACTDLRLAEDPDVGPMLLREDEGTLSAYATGLLESRRSQLHLVLVELFALHPAGRAALRQ